MSMLVVMHSIWLSGAAIMSVAIAVALLAQLVVQRYVPTDLRRDNNEAGAAIFSVIGVTYAVLLAFVAMSAWERHSQAEASARREANTIDAIHRASRALPEPLGATLRADAAAYLKHIIDFEWPAQVAGSHQPAVEPLLERLYQDVLDIRPTDMGQSNVQAFLIPAANDVVALRRDRRLAVDGTIPDLVWLVLLAGGALMVGFSFVLGGSAIVLHLSMTAVLVASGVLILLLVLGLSSPFHGEVTISPETYREVLREMG